MIESIYSLLVSNVFIFGFLGTIFFGETVIITATTIATIYSYDLLFLFFLFFLGVYIADYLWFLIGKNEVIYQSNFLKKRLNKKIVPKKLRSFLTSKPILALSLVKLTYGIRIITIIYYGHRFKKDRLFLKNNILPCIIGILPSFILGFLAGKGLKRYVTYIEDLRLYISLLILSILICIFIIKIGEIIWKKIELKKGYLQ